MKESTTEHLRNNGGALCRMLPVSVVNRSPGASPLGCEAQQSTSLVKLNSAVSDVNRAALTSDSSCREQISEKTILCSALNLAPSVEIGGKELLKATTSTYQASSTNLKHSDTINCGVQSFYSQEADTVEAVMTCEGDLNSPHFKRKFAALQTRLTRLLKTSRRSLNVKKLEPWNSVKVTMQLPRRLAEKLKKLAESDSDLLRSLGVLGIQVQGDRHINLSINNSSVQSQSQSQSSSSNVNNIVSIINQLVTEGNDPVISTVSNVSSCGPIHLPSCALLVRRFQTDGDLKSNEVSEISSPVAITVSDACDHVGDGDDQDQVVCTCGVSASLTPASSSYSATSGAFSVPTNTSKSRAGKSSDPYSDDSHHPHHDAASNGCSEFANFNSLSPPPKDDRCTSSVSVVNGAHDRYVNGASASASVRCAVPASLSNFAADANFAAREETVAVDSALIFALNDDNILDDCLDTACPLPAASSNGRSVDISRRETDDNRSLYSSSPNQVQCSSFSKLSPTRSEKETCSAAESTDSFARPLRPQLQPQTVMERGEKLQIIRLPPRGEPRLSDSCEEASKLSLSVPLSSTKQNNLAPLRSGSSCGSDGSQTSVGIGAVAGCVGTNSQSQVRIIQIPSSNHCGSKLNSSRLISVNGVLLNGARETNLKRIRIDNNSLSYLNSHSNPVYRQRSSDSDEDSQDLVDSS